MTPEVNSFICGDCMDYLSKFPDKYFELAIIDPPYGIGEDGSKNKSRGKQADFGKGGQGKVNVTPKTIMYICVEIYHRIRHILVS